MYRNRDVVGASCVKDSIGKIVVEDDRLTEIWRAHYDMISNEEFSWDKEGLKNVSPVCGPIERNSALEVAAAILSWSNKDCVGDAQGCRRN